VEEALKRMPQDVVDARNQRLKRAQDISMKHTELPKDMQQLQTPLNFYLRDTLEARAVQVVLAVSQQSRWQQLHCCLPNRVQTGVCGSGQQPGAGVQGLLELLSCLLPCRLCKAAAHVTSFPLPAALQLVKLENDERLALGTGKAFERHLP
jgi:hypothetical protein